MNALEIKGLSKNFSNFELKDISFNLPSGCIMGLVGENGAGKSTTIKLILNILKKDAGEIQILSNNYYDGIKEDIGVVLDDLGLPDCLDIYKTDKVIKEFSKGNKAKLAIIIALSHKAKLLLLDEPTSGLDPLVRDEILDILNDYTRDENNSILISSHIVSDLEKLCDYIVFIHDGRIMLNKEEDELLNEFGVINCSLDDFAKIDKERVLHYEENPYGVKAIVKRAGLDLDFEPVNIEELFVNMVKELKK